ncbi:MAG: protein-tyrosine phosphatase family protein [Limnobacter sp.]|uniref:protein-tyrosine phosphatase family protein n=1 Tax=Limnobacter sp. TaxID=2003368 RepID=UPI0022C2EC0C|nr:protein-tyrosine phosphatase family protein [Limnobacter sp.]MCZ8016009.1 protein-tyrosine phosphatase family protein [Limnobacter sp.]
MESSTSIWSRLSIPQTFEHREAQTCVSEVLDDPRNWQINMAANQRPDQTSLHRNKTAPQAVVQQALRTLSKNDLTESQHATAAGNLWSATQEMLVQEGCTTKHPFTFNGRTVHLNALQLMCFSATLANETLRPTPIGIEQALNEFKLPSTVKPEVLVREIRKTSNTQTHFHTSQLPLSRVEQSMAKAVIDILPPHLQGSLQGLDAVLIDRQTFSEVMRQAADQPGFPEVLKQLRQAARHCPGIQLALTTQPSLAFALLFPGRRVTPATPTPAYLAQVTKKIAPEDLTRLADQPPAGQNKQTTWNKVLSVVFRNMNEFGNRNSAPVPSCYDNIPCPEHSRVKVDGHPADVHANLISDTGPGSLIAAMQPVTTGPARHLSNEDQANVAKFLSMVAGQDKPTILDLRSASDLYLGKGIEYCPQQVDQTHQFDNVSIATRNVELLANDLQRLTVEVTVGQNPAVELKVTQFRGWPDRGVVEPDKLRMLGQLVCQEKQAGSSVITHCSAGVGRTGTILAYARLYQKLIGESGAKEVFNDPDSSEPSRQKVIEKIVAEVLHGRIERGPQFVQKDAQFKLLCNTILEDIQAWKNNNSGSKPDSISNSVSSRAFKNEPPPGPKTTPAPLSLAVPEIEPAEHQPALVTLPNPGAEKPTFQVRTTSRENQYIGLNINQIELVPEHAFTLAQEPKNTESKFLYLHSLFNRGSDVLEFVSDPNRLAKFASIPEPHGVNILSPIVLNKFSNPAKYGPPPELIVGKFRINDVEQTVDALNKNGCLAYSYQFNVTDKETGLEKTVRHVQIYSEFKNNCVSKIQLKAMLKLADECQLNQNNLWLSSAAGIGRPSAWLMARHIDDAIHAKKMTKSNCRHLIDSWIKTGRDQRGPRFLHSTAQKEELVQLALDLLKNKKSIRNQEPPAGRQLLFKKPKTFGQRISSFPELVSWIKKHLHPSKTTTQSPPQPVSTNPPW